MKPHPLSLRVRKHKALHWLLAFVPLTGLMTGCAFVFPVPTAYHPAGSRRNLTEATATRFVPGTATLDDVVLALGEPDQIIASPLKLTYEWERVNFHLVSGWAIGLPGTGIGNGSHLVYGHHRTLMFNFDDTGALEAVEFSDVKTKLDEIEARGL